MTTPNTGGEVVELPFDVNGQVQAYKAQRDAERERHGQALDELAVCRGLIDGMRADRDRMLKHVDELEAARRGWDKERTMLVAALDGAGIPLPAPPPAGDVTTDGH